METKPLTAYSESEFIELYNEHIRKSGVHLMGCSICEEKSIRDGGVRTTVDLLSRMREQKEAETLDKVDKLNTEMKTDEIVGEMLDVATALEESETGEEPLVRVVEKVEPTGSEDKDLAEGEGVPFNE